MPSTPKKLRCQSNDFGGSLIHGARTSWIINSPSQQEVFIDDVSDQFDEQVTLNETEALLKAHNSDDADPCYGTLPSFSSSSSNTDDSIAYVDDDAILLSQDKSAVEELAVLLKSSLPLIITFSLQNSLSLSSIFFVGHLGKKELAAISLGSMTANITGFAAVQGLSTCLDTLCCQAYGAKHYKLVGVYFQRCCALIFTVFLPIVVFWFYGAEPVLLKILPAKEFVPEGTSSGNMHEFHEIVQLSVGYLKVISLGMPAFILFECGKRFLQCQGVFHAGTYILLVCSPINALLNYLLVWNKTFALGFLGAPLAVAIVHWITLFGLLFYIFFVNRKLLICWDGLNVPLAFKHWNRMFSLAINGLVMVWAEFLAFEILTLYSSYLGIVALDANSVISSITGFAYQVPFAISIAGSTRLAQFIGAGLKSNAQKSSRITFVLGLLCGVLNGTVIFVFKSQIARLFTSDADVVCEIEKVLNIVALIEIFDATNSITAGILRGQGRQHVGCMTNMIAYYVVALPLAYILSFKLDWDLMGLWIGTGFGLFCISLIQSTWSLVYVNWEEIIYCARKRDELESAS